MTTRVGLGVYLVTATCAADKPSL